VFWLLFMCGVESGGRGGIFNGLICRENCFK